MGIFDFFRKKTSGLVFAATLTLSACAGGQHKMSNAGGMQVQDFGMYNVTVFDPSTEMSAPGKMQLDGVFSGEARIIARRIVMMVRQNEALPAEIKVAVKVQSEDVTLEEKDFMINLDVKEILSQSKLHTVKQLELQVNRVFSVVSNVLQRQALVKLHDAEMTVAQAPDNTSGNYEERLQQLNDWKKKQLKEAQSKQIVAFKLDKKGKEYKKKMAQAVAFLDGINAEYNAKVKKLKQEFKK